VEKIIKYFYEKILKIAIAEIPITKVHCVNFELSMTV